MTLVALSGALPDEHRARRTPQPAPDCETAAARRVLAHPGPGDGAGHRQRLRPADARGGAALTGWHVDRRDALCHLAARANDVPLVLRLLDWHLDLASGAAEAEAINAGQIASRAGRSVDELADEAVAGYAAARADVLKLDAAQLGQTIPDVPGHGPMSVADLVLVVYRHHAQARLASIEQALADSRE